MIAIALKAIGRITSLRSDHRVGRAPAPFLYLSIEERDMSIGTILLVILVLMLIGSIPTWPHSRGWGYGPSGGVGVIVLILLVLVLSGRL